MALALLLRSDRRVHADLFEELQVDLPAVPPLSPPSPFVRASTTAPSPSSPACAPRLEGDSALVFAVPPMSTERAVVLFEFYRRDSTWKVRAVGQGYDDGLTGLARDFGVTVT